MKQTGYEMSRRSELQLKNEKIEGSPPDDPIAHVPPSVMEQAAKIRAALKAGKALCQDCMGIFASAHGLKVHQYHCKGR
jgi:hypothetical protein